jgi:hypothetical protein
MDVRGEAADAQIQAYIDIDKKNLPMLEQKLKKVVYTDEQLAEFRKMASKPVIEEWIKENEGKLRCQAVS